MHLRVRVAARGGPHRCPAIERGREFADVPSVFGSFPRSRYMPCPECGASVDRAATGPHVCDAERLLDFRLFQLQAEIGAFDSQLAMWLASARGRFAAWIAERDRRAG
jgi:hypothetical protein